MSKKRKAEKQVAPPQPQPDQLRASFEPRSDIAAYELAMIVPFLIRGGLTEQAWVMLGPAQRHLRRL
jgi:hypothetical protein